MYRKLELQQAICSGGIQKC